MLRKDCMKKSSILFFLVSCLLLSCLKSPTQNIYFSESTTVSAQFFLRTYNLAFLQKKLSSSLNLDSVSITFNHTSLDTVKYRLIYQEVITIPSISLSDNWSVVVEIFNNNGEILYKGNKFSINIKGQENFFAIDCYPQVSKLKFSFILDSSINHGNMLLIQNQDTLNLNLKIEGSLGVLKADKISPGRWITKVFLYNRDSNLTITADTFFVIEVGRSQNISIVLKPKKSDIRAKLVFKEIPVLEITAQYTTSQKREPLAKDLIVSEFFPDPEKGEKFEWMEIVNTTIDTLNTASCQISKSRTSGASSTLFNFDSTSFWLPGQALVLGQDSVLFRDITYPFRLTNTKQSILILCSGVLIDSLSYTSQNLMSDSIFVQSNFIASKSHFFYKNNNMGSNWCTSQNSMTNVLITPKNVLSGCIK